MDELMTIDEVSEYLRVPVPTIRWLRQDGRFVPQSGTSHGLDLAGRAVLGGDAAGAGVGVSIQRYTKSGRIRYRARVKHHGREVATRVFDRKSDAVIWEEEQKRRLRLGGWIDPKRGRAPLSSIAAQWLESRQSVKRRTLEADWAAFRLHIEPRFGGVPIASITSGEVAPWVGGLVASGRSPLTAAR